MRLLFLYEELAWYFINCLNTLAGKHDADIILICKQPNAVAPFEYSFVHPRLKIIQREGMLMEDYLRLYHDFNPNMVYVGGWACKEYLAFLKKVRHHNVVIGFDNQWNGSLKQIAGAIYFRLTLKSIFNGAFVPGPRQHKFATKLGFSKNVIVSGAYCGDYEMFHSAYLQFRDSKRNKFPRRLLYVGRYAPEKGIRELWGAFINIKSEKKSDWELWCAGIGPIPPVEHEAIRHFGFVQPGEMNEIIRNSGAFILPSTFEPWGVVVHEYAAAGLALVLSDAVGASDTFLDNGENGFTFASNHSETLKNVMDRIMQLSDDELADMGERSAQIAGRITPEKWCTNLLSFIPK